MPEIIFMSLRTCLSMLAMLTVLHQSFAIADGVLQGWLQVGLCDRLHGGRRRGHRGGSKVCWYVLCKFLCGKCCQVRGWMYATNFKNAQAITLYENATSVHENSINGIYIIVIHLLSCISHLVQLR